MGIKISDLPAAVTAESTDVIPADQSDLVTRKIALSQIATLLNDNFIQLDPSADQTIASDNLTLQSGIYTSGSASGGVSGSFKAFTTTSAKGSVALTATNNAANYANVLTNTSTTAARTWTLPDATGTLATSAQVQSSGFNKGTDTGVADAYVVNLSPAITALTDGLLLTFKTFNFNTSTSPTITVNGFTAPVYTIAGLPISVGDFNDGYPSYLIYSTTISGWMYLNAPVSNVTAWTLQNGVYTIGTDTGSANAYQVAYNLGYVASPSIGAQLLFPPAHSNTTTSTLTLGVNTYDIILMNGNTLPAGAITTGVNASLVLGRNINGTLGWILLNPQGVYTPSLPYVKVNGTESGNAVTASGYAGVITTSSLTTAAAGNYAITWTNTKISSTSVIGLTIQGGTNTTTNINFKVVPGSGSATLTIYNNATIASLNGTVLIGYVVQ